MSAGSEAAGATGSWAAIWRWLRSGRRRPGRFAVYSGPRRPTRWGIPKRVWRALRVRQVVELTPIIYVIVVGGGLVIGVALQLTLGVWWWMPAAALLVALWPLEGSSAFWGGRFGRRPYTLRTELLAAFAPRRGAVARRAEDRAELLGCGLPFFAPAEWTGAFAFGGRGGRGGKLTTVSIVCLPPGREYGSGTDLTITTEADTRDEDGVRWHLFRPGEGEAAWLPLVLRVDGRDLSGWSLEHEGRSYRYARVGDCWVTVEGPADDAVLPLRSIDPASVGGS